MNNERISKVKLFEREPLKSDFQNQSINCLIPTILMVRLQSYFDKQQSKATRIHNFKAQDDQKIKATKVVESSYSKTERALILELGRIGNNVNQIAKAVNTDIAGVGTFDKVKLLHLLISIDQQLRELRPDDR